MLMNRMQSTSDIQRQDMIRPVGGTKSCFILRIVFNHHHHQQSTQDWKTKMIKKRKRLFLRPVAAVCRGHEVLMSICASSLGLLQRYERPQLRNRQDVHGQVLERPMSQRPNDVSKN
ncbi:hypothetical protein F2Q68_00041244 [Brassica cretica]|uniref:Uncharacterized protein n=2 Tax=Brassica cretica TaxID=69181 RepID=A0ABQ7AMK2_BRACR|nr:hypothetical protein F2Q68_00041244 [Brassica cretica]KAF3498939.1 hypothetical protein DY000_02055689 [Brassica cretica]